jgi:hypothetical protein
MLVVYPWFCVECVLEQPGEMKKATNLSIDGFSNVGGVDVRHVRTCESVEAVISPIATST